MESGFGFDEETTVSFLEINIQCTVRLNGGKLKHQDELIFELTEDGTLKDLIKTTCKKLGGGADYHRDMIYNKYGIILHE